MNRDRDIPDDRDRDLERTRQRDLPRFAPRDLAAVRDISEFRAVRPRDLAAAHYDGREREIDKLVSSGYVRRYTLVDPRIRTNEPAELVMITAKGRSLLRRMDPQRSVYLPMRTGSDFGVKRSRELTHDADVFPAVDNIRRRLESDGAQVTRVVSGTELSAARSRLANEASGGRQRNTKPDLKRQREIAEALDLKVVDGRVRIPDARVIYVDGSGRERHIDVEVTTPNYGRAERGAKSRAGFHLVSGVSFTHGKTVFREM